MTYIKTIRIDFDSATPLAAQIQQQFATLIASGVIEPLARLPPVREMARQLGVNLHTVRAAYRQLEIAGMVTTRQGVGTIVQPLKVRQKNYRRGISPTFTIGVLLPWFTPFYMPLQRGILDAAQEGPYLVIMCDTKMALEVSKYVDQLVAKNVDGIIVVSQFPFQESGVGNHLLKNKALPPMVFTDWPTAPDPAVLFDMEEGGFLVTRHLVEHGYERIALITPSITLPTTVEVYNGYLRALETAGLSRHPDDILIVPDWTKEAGFQGALKLLSRPDPPRAIFAITDELAIGALKAIKSQGLRVPEDIALAGHGETEFSGYLDPPLTTIALPAYSMGVEALHMLQKSIAGEDIETPRLVLNVTLTIGKSCGCD